MSDPRKNFRCYNCGAIINDLDRQWGSKTPCYNCIEKEYDKREEALKTLKEVQYE